MKGLTAGLVVIMAGYAIASYGVVLLRGYDIRWSSWINPLNPYVWPAGPVPNVPPTQVFPQGSKPKK